VDDSVGAILDELKRDGERRDTYVFFVSDNGFLFGQHRIRAQKRYLYEESARVPFVARGPGIARGESSEDVVVNADITSTILDISGAVPGLQQDGQSLLPSLVDPESEHARAILLEAEAGPEIVGVRTWRYLYTQWDTGTVVPEPELYDNVTDPYQLNNLALNPAYASVVAELAGELNDLRDCAGADCRTAPTGALTLTSGGNGKGGCSYSPVIAHLNASDQDRILSVSFRAGNTSLGDDSSPPYEIEVPYPLLQKALPDPVSIAGSALYSDGRRLTSAVKAKACRS
jgi:hypothetical protein